MTCTQCEKRNTCIEICDVIEQQLPDMRQGEYMLVQHAKELLCHVAEGKRTTRIILDYLHDKRLTERQRKLLYHYYVEQLPIIQISEIINQESCIICRDLHAVRRRIARLLNKDRQKVSM